MLHAVNVFEKYRIIERTDALIKPLALSFWRNYKPNMQKATDIINFMNRDLIHEIERVFARREIIEIGMDYKRAVHWIGTALLINLCLMMADLVTGSSWITLLTVSLITFNFGLLTYKLIIHAYRNGLRFLTQLAQDKLRVAIITTHSGAVKPEKE